MLPDRQHVVFQLHARGTWLVQGTNTDYRQTDKKDMLRTDISEFSRSQNNSDFDDRKTSKQKHTSKA